MKTERLTRSCIITSSTHAVLYCATSLRRYVCALHVVVIELSLNESVTFARCAWAPRDQIDVRLIIIVGRLYK